METAPSDPKKVKPSNAYLRYSGLGIQLLVSIGAFAWLGHWLDQSLGLTFPAFLLTLVILSFAGNMILLYRSINKD
jgi:ATP synthase protein I